jgi:beta-1,4-mannosyltransferase
MDQANSQRVSVIVLGDIGRSPRMQYHALSLAVAGSEVDVIGYGENRVFPTIAAHERIRWHNLSESWRAPQGAHTLLFLAAGAMKAIWDSAQLFWFLLAVVARPDAVLVQNPPSIPTLLVAWIAARLRGARFAIDWHNFGYSMVALKLGSNHALVGLCRWFEQVVSRRADVHLCVSQAMQRILRQNWGITAAVLYDCSPDWFGRSPVNERETILSDLLGVISGRARLLVSPSSWTADEDYALLLEGLRQWDERLCSNAAFNSASEKPELMVLLTGKGPLRARFEAEIAQLTLCHIAVRTLWVDAPDYPRLLGIADAGICVHRSASGVDLPMKIADMFGSGLPVVAFDYGPCLRERVQPGVTGLCFRSAEELGQHLYELFACYPAESPLLHALRANVLSRAKHRWEEEWTAVARPLLLS